jgi:hypothetical protein
LCVGLFTTLLERMLLRFTYKVDGDKAKACDASAHPSASAEIPHGDHVDILVGKELHHVTSEGCTIHGELQPFLEADAESAPSYAQAGSSDSRLIHMLDDEINDSSSLRPRRQQPAIMANTIDTLAAAVVSAEINATKDNVHTGSIMKGWDKDVRRFMVMLFLTASFMIVELVSGIVTGSVALQADAFHMLSDVISLAVGFYAVKATKRSASVTATYGLVRYEIVGALINGVFLLATCLGIIIEVIQRFVAIEDAHQTVDEARVLMVRSAILACRQR